MTVNAGCGGYRPVPNFHEGGPPAPKAVAGTPLTEIWSQRALRGPSAPVAIDGLNLYVAGSDRHVVAVDLASGRTRWSVILGGPIVGGVLQSGRLLYAATDRPEGRLHALQVESGNELWTAKTGESEAPLALIEGKIIVVNRIGIASAVDPNTGRVDWQRRIGPALTEALAGDSGRAIITTLDSLFLVSIANGNIVTRAKLPGPVVGGWVLRETELVGGTADSAIVGIDRGSLQLRWRLQVDAPVLSRLALRGDSVTAVTRIGTVYRVLFSPEPSISQISALGLPVTATPTLMHEWVLVGSSNGELRAVSPDGAIGWQVMLSRPVDMAPVFLSDSALYAFGGRGDLYRFGL